jgi:hypothetical protein
VSMTVSLTTHALIYKCLYCKQVYKSVPDHDLSPSLFPADVESMYSHGVCTDCEPVMWKSAGMMKTDPGAAVGHTP